MIEFSIDHTSKIESERGFYLTVSFNNSIADAGNRLPLLCARRKQRRSRRNDCAHVANRGAKSFEQTDRQRMDAASHRLLPWPHGVGKILIYIKRNK
jgi:hypothetical protein